MIMANAFWWKRNFKTFLYCLPRIVHPVCRYSNSLFVSRAITSGLLRNLTRSVIIQSSGFVSVFPCRPYLWRPYCGHLFMMWSLVSSSSPQFLHSLLMFRFGFRSLLCRFRKLCPVRNLTAILRWFLSTLIRNLLALGFGSGKNSLVCQHWTDLFHLRPHSLYRCLFIFFLKIAFIGFMSPILGAAVAPSLASLSASSFPWCPTWARIHLKVMFMFVCDALQCHSGLHYRSRCDFPLIQSSQSGTWSPNWSRSTNFQRLFGKNVSSAVRLRVGKSDSLRISLM